MRYIHLIPGIRYRELQRLTAHSNGVLSYHLRELEIGNYIKVERRRAVTRYYPPHIATEVSRIVGCIRNPVSRQIISLLLENNGCNCTDLTIAIGRAPSTISWHLQKLVRAGVLKISNESISGYRHSSKYYCVQDRLLVAEVLSKYVESPLDKLVSDYSDLMEEFA
jgi:predicted transcriptional regulator